jgi:hypothetical protein
MAVATISQIVDDVKKVLPIYDTTLYNDDLNIIVNGAVHKLDIEGVPNQFDYQTPAYYDYITCIRYQVACDMDLDIDIERLKAQYITRANTLRCSLSRSAN